MKSLPTPPTTSYRAGGSSTTSTNYTSISSPYPPLNAQPPEDLAYSRLSTWQHPIQMQDQLHLNHPIIGGIEGTDLRLACLNINSLTDAKVHFLAWMFTAFKLDVLTLQDTRIPAGSWHSFKESVIPLFQSDTLFLHSPPATSTDFQSRVGGIALIISARCRTSSNYRGDPLQCGSICSYCFATQLGRLLIIATYFPNKPTSNQPGSLWQKIASALPTNSNHTPLTHLMDTANIWSSSAEASAGTFLLGDLNSSLGHSTGGCHNISE